MRRSVAFALDGRYEVRSGFRRRIVLTTIIHGQMRLQVCTVATTNVILGQIDSAQAQMTAMSQQVLTILQHGPVQQCSRSLSMQKDGLLRSGEVPKTDPTTPVEISEICAEGEVRGDKLPIPTGVVGSPRGHWYTGAFQLTYLNTL